MPEDPKAKDVLDYLQGMRGYPFDAPMDSEFVAELLADFPSLDVLEQIKAFRWHNGGDPAKHFKSLRPALRRWLAAAKRFDREPF
jgi:hypothetical protein